MVIGFMFMLFCSQIVQAAFVCSKGLGNLWVALNWLAVSHWTARISVRNCSKTSEGYYERMRLSNSCCKRKPTFFSFTPIPWIAFSASTTTKITSFGCARLANSIKETRILTALCHYSENYIKETVINKAYTAKNLTRLLAWLPVLPVQITMRSCISNSSVGTSHERSFTWNIS